VNAADYSTALNSDDSFGRPMAPISVAAVYDRGAVVFSMNLNRATVAAGFMPAFKLRDESFS
jgi:hypothetical protein